MNLSDKPNGSQYPTPVSETLLLTVTPVYKIGAVSPAALATCRITPVKIPLIELGKTIVRMVCHRLAPKFQHASRNDIGTDPSASFVLAMITGNVITASVHEAASSDLPICANATNAPTPKRPWTILGTPARFTTARLMMRVYQLFFAYSFK